MEQDVKPVVVIAQDNLFAGPRPDSARYRASYANELRTCGILAQDYDRYTLVNTWTPGWTPWTSRKPPITQPFDELYATYSNRNLVPSWWPVTAGTTAVSSGLQLPKAERTGVAPPLGRYCGTAGCANRRGGAQPLAYLGNRFPVEVRVEGFEVPGESATVTIARKGQALYSEVLARRPAHSQVVRTTLETEETGLQQYGFVSVLTKK